MSEVYIKESSLQTLATTTPFALFFAAPVRGHELDDERDVQPQALQLPQERANR